ncbi:cytochrome P450 [Micromonospora sp. NPDC004704]
MTGVSAPAFDGPHSPVDPWSDDVLRSPFRTYTELRDAGPAVWLDRYDMVAIPRFAEVKSALANWRAFSSASGAAVEPEVNAVVARGVLGTDPPQLAAMRERISRDLTPRRVAARSDLIRSTAEAAVTQALAREEIDAVGELAGPYVASLVGSLLELPESAVADLPSLSATANNLFGPASDRQREGLEAFATIGSRAAQFAVQRVPAGATEQAIGEKIEDLGIYMFPGVETTIQALTSVLYLFARHPEQWKLLREDPSRIPDAIAEALRLHSPIRHFTRMTTRPTDVGTVTVPEGTRVLIMYGSANRDERNFPDPDAFNITREPSQNMAFGHGAHHCVGKILAHREIHTILESLLPQVRRIILREEPRWGTNLVHGLERLDIAFERE